MANNPNNNNIFSSLPAELRRMILGFIMEDSQLWVGSYRVPGQDGQDVRFARRVIDDGHSTGEYPPHPLLYVRPIAHEFRQRWQRHFNGRLNVDDWLTSLPPPILNDVTDLSLTMVQAAQILQARVPHLRAGHNNFVPPNTRLVLPHCPNLQHLEIQWDLPFFFPAIISPRPSDIQAALVRLMYFRRSFQVAIHFRACNVDNTGSSVIWASGTIVPTTIPLGPDPYTFQFHNPCPPGSLGAILFERQLRGFGWKPALMFTLPNHQHFALVGAHPLYEYAPLGWDPINRTVFSTDMFGNDLGFDPPSDCCVGPTLPEFQNHHALLPDFAVRRNAPRPWDP